MTKVWRFTGRKHGTYITPSGLMKFLRQVTPLDIPNWRIIYSFKDTRTNTIAFAVRNINGHWVGGVFKCFIVDPVKSMAAGKEAPVSWIADLRLVITDVALEQWRHGIESLERFAAYSETRLKQFSGCISHIISIGESEFHGVGKTNIAFALAPSNWKCSVALFVIGKVYPVKVGQSFAGWTWGRKNIAWKPEDGRYVSGFRLLIDHIRDSLGAVKVNERTTTSSISEEHESVVEEILSTIKREPLVELSTGSVEVRHSFSGSTLSPDNRCGIRGRNKQLPRRAKV